MPEEIKTDEVGPAADFAAVLRADLQTFHSQLGDMVASLSQSAGRAVGEGVTWAEAGLSGAASECLAAKSRLSVVLSSLESHIK